MCPSRGQPMSCFTEEATGCSAWHSHVTDVIWGHFPKGRASPAVLNTIVCKFPHNSCKDIPLWGGDKFSHIKDRTRVAHWKRCFSQAQMRVLRECHRLYAVLLTFQVRVHLWSRRCNKQMEWPQLPWARLRLLMGCSLRIPSVHLARPLARLTLTWTQGHFSAQTPS